MRVFLGPVNYIVHSDYSRIKNVAVKIKWWGQALCLVFRWQKYAWVYCLFLSKDKYESISDDDNDKYEIDLFVPKSPLVPVLEKRTAERSYSISTVNI